MVRKLFVILVGFTMAASACGKKPSLRSQQAVLQAIEEHLRHNSNLREDQFTTEIENVQFQGDTATALVRYRSKQVAQFAVEVRYSIKLAGDHWEVMSSSAVSGQGMNAHGNAAGAAPGVPSSSTSNAPGPAVSH